MTTATFVSTPGLTVAGRDQPDLADNVLSLTVEESIVGMCWCELRIANFGYRNGVPDYLYLSRDLLDFGADLGVRLGPPDTGRQVFAGRISALQSDYPDGEPAQVLVFAEDGLQGLRLKRRTRTFTDSSTADIAKSLAADHGLTSAVDLDGPSHAVTAQLNQSDLAFLRDLARRDDGEVWLDGTTLHVASRPDRGSGTSTGPLDLAYGAGGELLSFSVRADLADQVTTLGVTGWDVSAKDAINETADSAALGSELAAGDTSGADVLTTTFGARTENIVRAAPLAGDEARSLAEAAYLERARRFVCGTGTTGGTPSVRVGATVALTGLGPMFNGDYYVSRTRHMFDMVLGYRTEFDVERPGIGAVS